MQRQEDVRRETYVALRARREAYQIASEILYEAPIDVRAVPCGGCGRWSEVRGSTVTDPLTCPACKARTPLPPYLRAKYLPRMPPRKFAGLSPPDELFVVVDPTDARVPRWLVWFTIALAAAGAGTAAALLSA